MTLHRKLLLAQAPLAAALAAIALFAGAAVTRLGEHSALILKENYRSVLAAQRMKEAVERIDSGALFLVAGRKVEADRQIAENERLFLDELAVEEGNITEPGEVEAAGELRRRFEAYVAELERYRALGAGDLAGAYFERLEPLFVAVKDGAEHILAINQDAMVFKSDRAERTAHDLIRLLAVAGLAAVLLGTWGTASLVSRLLRPLNVVSLAVRRFGQGDLAARARITGGDELGQLARDFNAMADSLERYRKSSLGELLQAQQAAQAVIDAVGDPVVVFGLTEVTNVNEAASRLLGVAQVGGDSSPLAPADAAVRASLERMRDHVLAGHGVYQARGFEEAVCVRDAGGERTLLPGAAPVYGEEGEVAGAAVVLRDVTRLRRADELKNDLVAFVAHEFRTPLTSLQMAIHLCAEQVVGPLTEKQADLMFAARQDCERLTDIVEDLLDVSRMQEGELGLNRVPIAAEVLAQAAVDSHAEEAAAKEVSLKSELLPDTGEVLADAERVRLVFDNLVGNAIRFVPKGGEVFLRGRREEAFVRFEVCDGGPGIPKEHQALVFEKFYRAPGERSQGKGLGLYIARQIVQGHGGAIGVESEPGHGTTFWFTLPLAETRTTPGAPPAPAPTPE